MSKIISIPIAAIFLLNSIVYGIELPINEKLRVPLGFSSTGGANSDLGKRFNSELSRQSPPIEKYPIIAVLRRMRHGGSVYDMKSCINTMQLLESIAEECPSELADRIMAFRGKLIDEFSALRVLIYEPPTSIKVIPEQNLKDWERRLAERLDAFKKIQAELAELKEQIFNESFDKETVETMSTMFEEGVKEWASSISILEQGVNFTKGVVVKKEVNLNNIIKQAIEPKPYGKLVEFKENPVPNIYADPMMVLQIITNIIVNADKLKDKVEITKLTISARLSEDNKEVIIDITDNGLGFNKNMLSEKQERDGSYEVIFGYGITYREGGSGFGLAENDLYAKINNGSFRVFSRPSGANRGSSFIIRMPVLSGINEQPQVSSGDSTAIEQIKELQTSL